LTFPAQLQPMELEFGPKWRSVSEQVEPPDARMRSHSACLIAQIRPGKNGGLYRVRESLDPCPFRSNISQYFDYAGSKLDLSEHTCNCLVVGGRELTA